MSQQAVKLQINSLEALNRLIGGDTELEVQLQQQVVAEFTKRHLKAVVRDEWFQKWVAELKTSLQGEFKKMVESEIGDIHYGYQSVQITRIAPALKRAMQVEATKVAEKLISKATLSDSQIMEVAMEIATQKVKKELLDSLKKVTQVA